MYYLSQLLRTVPLGLVIVETVARRRRIREAPGIVVKFVYIVILLPQLLHQLALLPFPALVTLLCVIGW